MKSKTITTLFALGFAGSLQAAAVIENITATATSWWDMPTVSYQHPSNLVNNNGMSATYDITATHAVDGNAADQWHAVEWTNDDFPTITFDLGGAFDLAGVHIWNGNQAWPTTDNTGRGVNTFTLSVSSDGTNYTNILVGASLTRSPYTSGTGGGPISAQNFDLTGQTGITHVQLMVLSNHNSPGGGGDYSNLSEVMFTAIPEPGVSLLGGLGLLALLRRRRA